MALLGSIPRGYIWILVGVLLTPLVAWWVWANYFQTYHYAAVQEGVLYRDGLRSLREYETALGKSQAKMVVSLVDWQENQKPPFSQEADYCIRSKVKYQSIAIRLGGWPTSHQIQFFLKLVENKRYQPVLVHCAQGVRRTGMMVAAYQMSVLGWDKAKTKSAILAFGHSDRTVNDVKRFIDDYDPKTQELPTTMPVGAME